MNRELWKNKTFTNKTPINFHCPKCNVGILKLQRKEQKITPNGVSMEEQNYPFGIEHIFNGILVCDNEDCKEVVSISGKLLKNISLEKELPNGDWSEEYISQYEPMFFFPNLKIINLPKEVPKKVSEQINLSFSHYFNDLSSCANRIRNSVELILNDLQAPKWKKDKTGKKIIFKALHSRIEHFKNKKKNISELLLALKIIGNEGSHIGKINNDDILDAYEILEQVIEIAYIKNNKKVSELANQIVLNKKPRSKK